MRTGTISKAILAFVVVLALPAFGGGNGRFVRLRGEIVPAIALAKVLPARASAPSMTLTVVLNHDDQAGLDRYLHDLYDPKSPDYRHFLTQAQIAHRYGPSRRSYDRVLGYLRSAGLNLLRGSPNRMTITMRGSRAQVERAFRVRIRDYEFQRRAVYANERNPALPASIAAHVNAVLGLSDVARAFRIGHDKNALTVEQRHKEGEPYACIMAGFTQGANGALGLVNGYAFVNNLPVNEVPSSSFFVVADTIYNFQCAVEELNLVTAYAANAGGAAPLAAASRAGALMLRQAAAASGSTPLAAGAGQTIGLLELVNYHPSDVQNFLNLIGATSRFTQLSEVNVNGGASTPASAGHGEGETLMDIDAVLSLAPGATVKVYDANFSGPGTFQTLLNAMLTGGVNVISNSWAYCENQTTLADVQSLDTILQNAAAAGVTVLTGSGDNGNTCLDGSPNTVAVPADSPNITAVGGTSAQPGVGGTYGSETWWDGSQGTPPTGQGGYGVSRFFPRPAYQSALSTATGRSVPDIAIPADPAEGVVICQADAGGCPTPMLNGGTSLAAPIMAASVAVMNQRLARELGFLNPILYPLASTSAFHSPAAMGSDFAHVGLGSPNFGALLEKLGNVTAGSVSGANSAVVAYPKTAYADGNTQSGVTVQLFDGNFNPVSGVPVSLTANSGSSAVITPVNATSTVDNGAATYLVTDTVPETVTLTASTGGGALTQTATVDFVSAPATAGNIGASLANVPNDGTSSTTITVTLQNAKGQGASGKVIDLSQGAGHSVVTAPSPAVTNSSGQIQFTATDTTAETVTYTATDVTDSGLPIPGSATVTFGTGTGTPPCASAPSITPGAGYAVTSFATGFGYGNCIGPTGVAFDQSGNLYVADDQAGGVYRFPPQGGVADTATLLPQSQIYFQPIGLAFSKDGTQLYLASSNCNGTTGSCAIFQIDPSTGALLHGFAPNGNGYYALATDPISGDLFATAPRDGHVYRISNPASANPSESVYADPGFYLDGLAFAPNGTLYSAATSNGGDINQIDGTNSATPGAATVITAIPGSPDGIAVAVDPANPGQVQALYVNTNSGSLYKVDLTQNPAAVSTVFSGGSRGDFVAVGPDGCLYATQTDQVVKITAADGTCSLAPSSAAPLIKLTPTSIAPNPSQGGTQTFTATLDNVASPAGTPIYFMVDGANPGVRMVPANASGQAAFTYQGVDSGSDVVHAVVTLNGTTAVSNATDVVWAGGSHVTAVTLNSSATGGLVGQATTVTATLSDISANPTSGLAGQTVDFSLGNGGSCGATTGANGQASCTITPSVAGSDTLTATFAGTSQDTATSTATSFEVTSPPPAPPPTPTVTITVAPTTITLGAKASLTWSSTNATTCTASGAWSGAESLSGILSVAPTAAGNDAYVLTCVNAGGSASATATLTVQSAPSGGGGSGGGGALGLRTLGVLGGLVWLRRRRAPAP